MSTRIFDVFQHVIGDAAVERMIRKGILVIFNLVGRVGVNVWININAMQFANWLKKSDVRLLGPAPTSRIFEPRGMCFSQSEWN